jgi:hypothetical protein
MRRKEEGKRKERNDPSEVTTSSHYEKEPMEKKVRVKVKRKDLGLSSLITKRQWKRE